MRTLDELLEALPERQMFSALDPTNVVVEQVTGDSRQVRPGSLFVAVSGHRFDGHSFIPQSAAQGAVAVVGAKSPESLHQEGIALPAGIAYVQTPDSRQALAHCCAAFYGYPSRAMTVIGVTGTDGKTTTCSLIESILDVATQTQQGQPGRVGVITTVAARIRGVESDTGFHVTTPEAPDVQRFLAQMRGAGCRYAVVESTSHGLAQARVAAVDFDVAAVTNITHEHLDEHGTRDAYVAAKALLFRALYQTQVKAGTPRCAVLNADDAGSIYALRAVLAEATQQHPNRPVLVRTYGIAGQAAQAGDSPDVVAHNIVYAPDRTHFQVHWWGGEFLAESPLIGDFNVYNVLCAAAATLALDVEPAVVQQGIARFPGVLGRMQRIDRGQPFLAVVDFAHTPISLERALLTLRPLVGVGDDNQKGRLIAVFGSAGLRDRAKRRLMGQVSGRLADYTVITAEDPRTEDVEDISAEIAGGARQFAGDDTFCLISNRAAAIQFAVNMAGPGDVVAAFGKGHERSMCYGEIEHPWSDQEAMAQALEKRLGMMHQT
jgi:UDP-N-acetylmuramoyl-L-alanyl-D-glutamate--2,6-diaminopimelate ligase